MLFNSIDIFCHVVDNFGDIGVVCRFARELKIAAPQCRVRVFVDDLEALHCIYPETDPRAMLQEHAAIDYVDSRALNEALVRQLGVADVLVEAFACHIPEIILDVASTRRTYIINLEHLSAEEWVEGYHLKESLLGRGELRKYFFMPGFSINTGGVIIDTRVETLRNSPQRNRRDCLIDFLKPFGIVLEDANKSLVGTIFSYEYRFDSLLEALARLEKRVYLLAFDRKSIEGMMLTIREQKAKRLGDSLYQIHNTIIANMPFLAQHKYDELLLSADFNIVRGEDTLVRAILSERPFIWHAYKQENNYQLVKVKAFLETLRSYFDEEEAYLHYHEMLMAINDSSSLGITKEHYGQFLKDSIKIERAIKKMCYFIRGNCNLVKRFIEFLIQLKAEKRL